ncbi:3164_t:CDS:2 [Ambispora gerdemannii]|uniref:3164_t:CDS:1 n=1 Tax=Ambispora gerdemannii TaxID=144530 RepID=A0A9N8VMI7_9GLOM|nr:3164_t:CDS:2 [Ambispora gerdemannii]
MQYNSELEEILILEQTNYSISLAISNPTKNGSIFIAVSIYEIRKFFKKNNKKKHHKREPDDIKPKISEFQHAGGLDELIVANETLCLLLSKNNNYGPTYQYNFPVAGITQFTNQSNLVVMTGSDFIVFPLKRDPSLEEKSFYPKAI